MVSEPKAEMQQVIPIFNGEAYGFWKIKMKTIFITRKLWDVIEPSNTNEEDTTTDPNQNEERNLRDMIALQILQTAVTDRIFPRIAPASSAREAWTMLESEYQGSPQVRMIKLQSLRREYKI